MKKYLTMFLLLTSPLTMFAQDLEVFIECQSATGCKEMKVDDEKLQFEAMPAMVINEENLFGAFYQEKDINAYRYQNTIALQLNQKASEEMAALTKKNINKRLGLVFKNELLMAPLLQSEITDGSILLSLGMKSSNEALLNVPWLKEKINTDASAATQISNRKFGIYIAMALIALVGAMVFAFKKRKVQN